jgi:DNA-binding NarL/FixJ family response regulator
VEGGVRSRGRQIGIVLAAPQLGPWQSLVRKLDREGFVFFSAEESIERAVSATLLYEPDVLLVADDGPASSLAAIAQVTHARPQLRVVVVAESVDEEECLAYVLAGASAYLSHDAGLAGLTSALRSVAAGLAIVPAAAQRRIFDELRA